MSRVAPSSRTPANKIHLEEAADQILQACEDNERRGEGPPFFFIVGAGISKPPIKLAADIIVDCQAEAEKYKRSAGAAGRRPSSYDYSDWFEAAFPHAVLRQRYLQNLMEDKPISDANLRLAHLLIGRRVASLVVTTNFDDLLTRGLRLFGGQPVICDTPKSVERIDPEDGKRLQVVHAHGTHTFYDSRNLRHEIRSNAATSARTTETMLFLLDNLLLKRSPLVVGYGGWPGDVIMTALRRRLCPGRRLPFRLFWFCYTECEYERLPRWLRSSADVGFVVPRPQAGGQGGGSQPALDAKDVFEQLNRTMGSKIPPLLEDPLGFFAESLENSLYDKHGDDSIYRVGKVIDRIKRAKELLDREERTSREAQAAAQSPLEKVRDALRLSKYAEALSYTRETVPQETDLTQLSELMVAMATAAVGLRESPEESRQAYDLYTAFRDDLLGRNIPDAEACERVMVELTNAGNVFTKANRPDDALAAYKLAIERCGNYDEPALRFQTAKALLAMGHAYMAKGLTKEARDAFGRAANYRDSQEPRLLEIADRAALMRDQTEVLIYERG
ncbi:MAG: hypothetical protein M3416_00710 [Acidobacteriota bacterium]|nr:hypothetical protein [Acidobacteriota bacterium]